MKGVEIELALNSWLSHSVRSIGCCSDGCNVFSIILPFTVGSITVGDSGVSVSFVQHKKFIKVN